MYFLLPEYCTLLKRFYVMYSLSGSEIQFASSLLLALLPNAGDKNSDTRLLRVLTNSSLSTSYMIFHIAQIPLRVVQLYADNFPRRFLVRRAATRDTPNETFLRSPCKLAVHRSPTKRKPSPSNVTTTKSMSSHLQKITTGRAEHSW